MLGCLWQHLVSCVRAHSKLSCSTLQVWHLQSSKALSVQWMIHAAACLLLYLPVKPHPHQSKLPGRLHPCPALTMAHCQTSGRRSVPHVRPADSGGSWPLPQHAPHVHTRCSCPRSVSQMHQHAIVAALPQCSSSAPHGGHELHSQRSASHSPDPRELAGLCS